jgi:DNA topoisomerase-1
MINEFYKDFHKQIEDTSDNSGKFSGEKFLGVDPVSGKNVFVKIGRFGPVAQIGDTDSEEKPKFAGLHKDQSIESITLEEVLDLFAFPRTLGEYEDAEIQVAIGRFGPYIKHNNTFYSLSKLDDPSLVTFMRAVEIIESKRKADLDNIVSTYPENEDLKVLKGRFGIYIAFNKQNYKIPKTYDPTNLSYQDCMDMINDPNNASKKRGKKS